jgi:hypothetical protein
MNLWDEWANSLWSLSAAVEWIAEHGGDYSDGFLDAAANELLRALQAGEITASGEISDEGRRANIPPEEFLIAAPYETFSPSEHPAGPAPMLCWGAYVDCVCDRDWRASSGDIIARPYRIYWQRISVLGDDVRTKWPTGNPLDAYRTGAPGRPSAIQFVVREAERRRNAGEAVLDLKAEANALHEWCCAAHPNIPAPSPGTIENKIRNEHREWKASGPHN